jgi:hypothetical protein
MTRKIGNLLLIPFLLISNSGCLSTTGPQANAEQAPQNSPPPTRPSEGPVGQPSPEICSDGIDNDGDGLVDRGGFCPP